MDKYKGASDVAQSICGGEYIGDPNGTHTTTLGVNRAAKAPKIDNVKHPSHYADKEIEVIDYIKDTLTHEQYIGYCLGNVIKYISRYRKKNGKEDLQKAMTYLEWAIRDYDKR